MGVSVVEYPSFDGTQLCAQSDPEAWFPESPFSLEVRLVKKVCEACPFKDPCGEYALHYQVEGIWGATTASDRRKIRKKRNIKAIPLHFTLFPLSRDALRARERRATRKEPL